MTTYVLILLVSSFAGGGPVATAVIPGFADDISCRVAGNAAKSDFELAGKLATYSCVPHLAPKSK